MALHSSLGFIAIFIVVCISVSMATTYTCPDCDQMTVSSEVDGNNIKIHWIVNTKGTAVYGFRAVFYDETRTVIYESPILHVSQRDINIRQELTSDTSICIQILGINGTIVEEKCEVHDVTDLKAIVGILAGTIFLIPCLVGLMYIIYKDKKVTKKMDYEKLEHASLQEQDSPQVPVKSKLPEKQVSVTGNVNLAFQNEIQVTIESEQETSTDETETDSETTASVESVDNSEIAEKDDNIPSDHNTTELTESVTDSSTEAQGLKELKVPEQTTVTADATEHETDSESDSDQSETETEAETCTKHNEKNSQKTCSEISDTDNQTDINPTPEVFVKNVKCSLT